MTWRLRIKHRTGFRYENDVVASYNEARMTPVTNVSQTALEARVDVRPVTATSRYWDYWGTQVYAFDVHVPHGELQVVATSVVETLPTPPPHEAAPWDALGGDDVRDQNVEWLTPTARTTLDDELAEQAAGFAKAKEPREAARQICDFVHHSIEYVPGATEVHASVAEVWNERKGVCQDIAHVSVSLLRACGIPARYVSGYLHPVPDAEVGVPTAGESHAWVEWWDGGWMSYDPTNDMPVGERHVLVGRGRDYGDVPPLKGLYSGTGSSTLGVTVEVTRLA
jgi:transglutaminase-like putative cysteine protease